MIVHARRAAAILYRFLHSGGRRGDFLVPANVCRIIPETFAAARVPLRFLDTDPSTLELDMNRAVDLLRADSRQIRGVLFVRPYGSDRQVDTFFRELKEIRSDFQIIDDKCLCRPDVGGEAVSPVADLTLFSTGRSKYADLGWGGFGYLDGNLEQIRPNSAPGWLELGTPEIPWERYSERIGAALISADRQKDALNEIYSSSLPRQIQMPLQFCSWRFNIRVPRSADLIKRIFAAGLFASRHYPVVDQSSDFPVAQALAEEVVNLFNDHNFDPVRARKIAEVISDHLRSC